MCTKETDEDDKEIDATEVGLDSVKCPTGKNQNLKMNFEQSATLYYHFSGFVKILEIGDRKVTSENTLIRLNHFGMSQKCTLLKERLNKN